MASRPRVHQHTPLNDSRVYFSEDLNIVEMKEKPDRKLL